MKILIPFLIILLVAFLEILKQKQAVAEPFIISSFTPIETATVPSMQMPTDKPLTREYWGPYLWGWTDRSFYEYGPETRAPYPYQFECDDYATQSCKNSCDNFCYKKHYMRCAAGNALVDPN